MSARLQARESGSESEVKRSLWERRQLNSRERFNSQKKPRTLQHKRQLILSPPLLGRRLMFQVRN